jgi:organic radical activating enzyme
MTLPDSTQTSGVSWTLPNTLVLLPTYRCSAACKNCCFQSNPKILHRVPQERLLGYIDQAKEMGTIRMICISGGEPFLLKEDLVEIIGRASHLGFLTRIVTNGFWATSEKSALRRLRPLVAAGLNEINFSTGDDHADFVSLQHVLNGLQVSTRLGLGVALMVEETSARKINLASIIQAAQRFDEDLAQALAERKISVVESPWMEFGPDDSKLTHSPCRLANASNVHFREPCKSIFTSIVVTPSEQLGICCGLPREDIADLNQGSLREHSMSALFDSGCHDFVKIWIFVEGPERILAWAATKDPSIDWENKYAHNCDACRAMYHDPCVAAVIASHYREKYEDVMNLFSLYLAGPREANPIIAAGFQRESAPIAKAGEGLIQIAFA